MMMNCRNILVAFAFMCSFMFSPAWATSSSTSTQSWISCAVEWGTCTFSGTQTIRFGANGTFVTKTATNAMPCTVDAFGTDPTPWVFKACDLLATGTAATTAGFSRTFVSPGGMDSNGCSVTDPCRTFQRAHDRTFINGEINCMDGGGYGVVAITKSITIDCKEVPASINAGTANAVGVSINIPTGNANDPLQVVRLRGFTISGAGGQTAATATTVTGVGTRVGSRGISITSASAVYIEHLVISDFVNQGIADTRTGTAKLFILDTVVRNNGGVGITPLASGGSNNTVVLDKVRSEGNLIGLAIGIGNNAVAERSVFSGNSTAGVEIDLGGSLTVNSSAISHNGIGVQNFGTVRLSNNDIAYNTTGITGASLSVGNNRLSGNTAAGTPPTAASQQ